MPVQPIDLQNMFLRLNQIGKEQADHREIVAQQQSAQNSEFVRETEHRDHSVNQSDDVSEGPRKADDEGAGKRQNEKQGSKSREKDKKSEDGQYLFKDPDLGQNIDITG